MSRTGETASENIDTLKRAPGDTARLTYKLKHANVYVSPGGHHFTDNLDPEQESPSEIDVSQLTGEASSYIETQLEANSAKFRNQVDIVKKYLPLANAKVLDVGCGGGLFLSLLKRDGAQVAGIEPSDSRAQHAITKHGLEIHKQPIESDFWQSRYGSYFDAVTLWDVIEHVNYPFRTLHAACGVLRKGGLVLIDTPCRDGFFHRVGEATYRLSRGRFPTFLNVMYSSRLFGHKQIFATTEIRKLFGLVGLEVVELHKFHELSFPCDFYLRKLFSSETVAALLFPPTSALLRVIRVQNKMLAVGRKL